VRSTASFASRMTIFPAQSGKAQERPFRENVRLTTSDFFAMFDVPFQYGGGWSRRADEGPENVVVLSKYVNDKLFAGENSVGREITLSGKQLRVVGVLSGWTPEPRYYDLNGTQAFDLSEDVYVPFGWGPANKFDPYRITCVSKRAKLVSYESYLTEDCGWLQYWVELDSAAALARYQDFVDNYVREQKRQGRFPRPLNNRLVNVATWLEMNNVVGDDSRTEAWLAVAFLAVCVLNTFGLMLARFLSAARVVGVRRALGASRLAIVRQHLTEVLVVGLIGGVLGWVLSFIGLELLRVVVFAAQLADNDNPARVQLTQSLSHMDLRMTALALGLSVLAGILAGLYPAWRIGRLAPASFLKTQ
jgi:putative ABC transport system permease protein